MGVFAGGWLGCAFSCSLGVFAFFGCWRVGWVVGRSVSRAVPSCLVCLLACLLTSLVWACLLCAMLPWVRGNGNGAGQRCPAPYAVGGAARMLRARGRREGLGGGGAPRGGERASLVIAYMGTGAPPVGAEQGVSGASGRASVGLAGGGGWWRARPAWRIQSPLPVAGGVGGVLVRAA